MVELNLGMLLVEKNDFFLLLLCPRYSFFLSLLQNNTKVQTLNEDGKYKHKLQSITTQ